MLKGVPSHFSIYRDFESTYFVCLPKSVVVLIPLYEINLGEFHLDLEPLILSF